MAPPSSTPTWLERLPKAELHAHLSGSVPPATLRALLQRPCNASIRESAAHLLDANTGRTLEQCFALFPVLHALLSDAETLAHCVREVLRSFAEDGVVYCEIRTTPRAAGGLSDAEYLDVVLKAVARYHTEEPDGVTCRVIVSVDRGRPVGAAWRALELAEHAVQIKAGDVRRGLVVGLELSGDPHKGQWSDFEPVFAEARKRLGDRLPISLHFAELDNEDEAMAMLRFSPERLGHAAMLSEAVATALLRSGICVEVCITSNLLTCAAASVADHSVITRLWPTRHPFCICTDDPSIFSTRLSDEYGLLVHELDLSKNEVCQLALSGLDQAFCKDEAVMARLRQRANAAIEKLCMER